LYLAQEKSTEFVFGIVQDEFRKSNFAAGRKAKIFTKNINFSAFLGNPRIHYIVVNDEIFCYLLPFGLPAE